MVITSIALAILVGLGVGLFVFAFYTLFNQQEDQGSGRSDVVRRLKNIAEGDERERKLKDRQKSQQELKETFLTLADPIAKNLYGQNKTYQSQVKALLTEAGKPDNDLAVSQFLATRVLAGFFVAGFMFITCLILGLNILWSMCAIIFGALIGMMMTQMQLRAASGKRKANIRYTISDTLDLMIVCVEAGLGLDATIKRIGDEVAMMAPELAYEFRRVTRELNAGIPRSDALQNLGIRCGVDELRSLCTLIIQSDKMGTSIANTLRQYAEDIRVKRKQKAEELAAKASIKMTFPLVLFIFPPMFIVLLGPTVINALAVFGTHKTP
ncbi:MAG: type II secretion system F family protein [Cyanobacteria bacterium]|nr:type II secretion system F family protein [Cyanobacteriota bacterium]